MALIDLHCHTQRHSFDSVLPPETLVELALSAGLDGVVITEHNYTWPREELDELLAATGAAGHLKLWAGQEIRVVEEERMLGDLLVFGPTESIPDGTSIHYVLAEVQRTQGYAIAAHVGVPGKGLELAAADYPLLAAEVWNGRYGKTGARQAEAILPDLRLPAVGGSDAHAPRQVAKGATRFPRPIEEYESFDDLAADIAAGRCEPWQPSSKKRISTWLRALAP